MNQTFNKKLLRHQNSSSNTLNGYIALKLEYQVGSGARFPDEMTLYTVAERLAKLYQEPDIFPYPQGKAVSERQLVILSGLLGLTRDEAISMREIALHEQNNAFAPSEHKNIPSLDDVKNQVQKLIQAVKTEHQQQTKPAVNKNPVPSPHLKVEKPPQRVAAHTKPETHIGHTNVTIESEVPPANPAAREATSKQVPKTDTIMPKSVNRGGRPKRRNDYIRPAEPEPDVVEAQRQAIAHARGRYDAMDGYNSTQAADIATELFLALFTNVPEVKNSSYLAGTLAKGSNKKISAQTVQYILAKGQKISFETMGPGGAADALTAAFLRLPEEEQRQAANYLSGIPWREANRSGTELVQLARSRGMEIGDMLRLKRFERRQTKADFAASLGLNESQYQRLSTGQCKRIIGTEDTVAIAANALGLTEGTPERGWFGHMAIGGVSSIGQAELDMSFTAGDKPYYLNAEAQGRERAVMLSRLYEMLLQRGGLRNFKELGNAIAAHAGLAGAMGAEIARCLNNTGARGGLSADEADIQEKSGKTLSGEMAKALADYAFPGEERQALRDKCLAFLSDEHKYHSSRSASATRAWANRRNKETGEPETGRGA